MSPPVVGEHSLAMAPSVHNPLSPGSRAPNMLRCYQSYVQKHRPSHSLADALKLGCPGFGETLGLQMVYLMATLPGGDGELQFLILYRHL